MAETTSHLFPLLAPWQLDAWVSGQIEKLRFDPETSMLTYRISDKPESRISFRVPETRIKKWHDIRKRYARAVKL
jgi:hypothetical protein